MRIGLYIDLLDYRTVPIVRSLITSFINEGNEVVLFSTAKIDKIKEDKFETVILSGKRAKPILPYLLLFKAIFYSFTKKLDVIIANDPSCIIPALIIKKIFRIKSIYLSLELFIKSDIDGFYYKMYYLLQKYFVRYFALIIIMDSERKKVLMDNCIGPIDDESVLLLANTSLNNNLADNKYLHKRLNIDENLKLILTPGELVDRSYTRELVERSKYIDNKYRLVLHSRRRRDGDPYLEELSKNENVTLSLDPVSYEELDSLYASAFIGLALYKIAEKGITAKNLYHIGKSSGKLNNFLKCGVPVIMSKLPFFEYIERKYNCGICIESIEELESAITKISKSYDEYAKNALSCFSQELNVEKSIIEISNKIRITVGK